MPRCSAHGRSAQRSGRAMCRSGYATRSYNGIPVTIQIIEDVATGTGYELWTSPALRMPSKWQKSQASSGGGSVIDALLLTYYGDLKNVTLVGQEMQGGMLVWHLKGISAQPGEAGNADLYLRPNNYAPVRFNVKTTGKSPETMTAVFNLFNTGATISLPPANQIQ